jgi:hypothetical protein
MQLLAVERAVVVLLELVEESARGGFRLGKIDRSVVIGIEAGERRSREGSRPFRMLAEPGLRELTSLMQDVIVDTQPARCMSPERIHRPSARLRRRTAPTKARRYPLAACVPS